MYIRLHDYDVFADGKRVVCLAYTLYSLWQNQLKVGKWQTKEFKIIFKEAVSKLTADTYNII
jgi:hypothetical protein